MKNVYSPVKLGLNQCPTWVHNDRFYILLGQFSIIEYMLSNCSLFNGLYIWYPYVTASLSIYHTIWPEILVGRYFAGLLKLWHLTGFTLAIEQVLAIMLFIGKWLIKCAGNFTGLWASYGLLGHNWWWNATENYTFRSRMTQHWASTILIERPKPGLHQAFTWYSSNEHTSSKACVLLTVRPSLVRPSRVNVSQFIIFYYDQLYFAFLMLVIITLSLHCQPPIITPVNAEVLHLSLFSDAGSRMKWKCRKQLYCALTSVYIMFGMYVHVCKKNFHPNSHTKSKSQCTSKVL